MSFSREIHISFISLLSLRPFHLASNKRCKEAKDWGKLRISAQLQSDSLKRFWLKYWLPCPDGGFLLPFVQPCNSGWISWDSCRGSKYEHIVAGKAGCNHGLVLLGCSDINSRRNIAKNKRQFPLCWKYVQLYFQTDGNTMWVQLRWSPRAPGFMQEWKITWMALMFLLSCRCSVFHVRCSSRELWMWNTCGVQIEGSWR